MKIWVDADACPGPIKELVIRAAIRLKIETVFVANKRIGVPQSVYISTTRIGSEVDEADRFIAEHANPGDLAITQDIPLAAALTQKEVAAISPHGLLFTRENIGERLSIRNLMQDIREAGGMTPGPAQFSRKDKQRFAQTFDRELNRLIRLKAS